MVPIRSFASTLHPDSLKATYALQHLGISVEVGGVKSLTKIPWRSYAGTKGRAVTLEGGGGPFSAPLSTWTRDSAAKACPHRGLWTTQLVHQWADTCQWPTRHCSKATSLPNQAFFQRSGQRRLPRTSPCAVHKPLCRARAPVPRTSPWDLVRPAQACQTLPRTTPSCTKTQPPLKLIPFQLHLNQDSNGPSASSIVAGVHFRLVF